MKTRLLPPQRDTAPPRLLKRVAEHSGWEIAGAFVDHAVSGTKGRGKRPEVDRMMRAATRREFGADLELEPSGLHRAHSGQDDESDVGRATQ